MLAADFVVALATAVLTLLFWTGTVEVWQILALLFVRALGGAFHYPAFSASTVLMVPEQHLTRIQGLNQALMGGLNIIGAPLGALLLEIMPMQGILAIDIVTAMIAIGVLIFIKVPQPAKRIGRNRRGFHLQRRSRCRSALRTTLAWIAVSDRPCRPAQLPVDAGIRPAATARYRPF